LEFLIGLLAGIEAAIDFPDDVEDSSDPRKITAGFEAAVIEPLQTLIRHHIEGRVLRDGLRVAVVGRPNVGKSSLLNCLVQKERAIVTEVPGTTRDMIEETLNIGGYPVILFDTAGLHHTDDPIETIGIQKTIEYVQGANLVLFMIEANRPVSAEDHDIFEQLQSRPVIIVMNKMDLINGDKLCQLPSTWEQLDCVQTSALYDRGIDLLKDRIIEAAFGKKSIDVEAVVVPNMRQKLLLDTSLEAAEAVRQGLKNDTPMELIAINIQEAIDSLNQILGTHVKVDLLDEIFSRFCIGK